MTISNQSIDRYHPLHLEEMTCTSLTDTLLPRFYEEKFTFTGSVRTVATYRDILDTFRSRLHEDNADLLLFPDGERWQNQEIIRRYLADAARLYAVTSKRPGRIVANTTRNLRLAALSSFYAFAERTVPGLCSNPILLIKRSKIEAYNSAKALEKEDVRARFGKIDTTTLQGLRDYVLLATLILTGRRVAEIQKLRKKHVSLACTGIISLDFVHMKGGKNREVRLDIRLSSLMKRYLEEYYQCDFSAILDEMPVWMSLGTIAHPHQHRGAPLGYQGIRKICEDHLGSSRVHTTRHTATYLRMKRGASLEEMQDFLMHSSVAVTQIYARHLKQSDDKYMSQVADDLL